MHEVQRVVDMTPLLRQYFGGTIGVFVSDLEKYLVAQNGTVPLKLKDMDPIKPGSMAESIIRERKRVVRKVGAEVYGVGYIGIGVPILEGQKIVGTFVTTDPTDNLEMLDDATRKMQEVITNTITGISSIAASSEQLAASANELSAATKVIEETIKQMDNVMGFIKDISSQTHLLGLNAAIEAARAGEAGRGFNVVAEEIRKLAGHTQSSAKDVSSNIMTIGSRIDALIQHILQISAVAEEQAASTQTLNQSIQTLDPIANEISKFTKNMLAGR